MSSEFDIITLRGLTARGQHGVFPFEREGTQPFSVDVALWVDTRPAAAADDIDLTVSYADIAEEAVAVLTGPSVYLLETLASRVADVALAHPRVEGVEVTVHKPMAPLRQQFSDVSVTIRRGAAAGVSGPDVTGDLPVVRDGDEGGTGAGVPGSGDATPARAGAAGPTSGEATAGTEDAGGAVPGGPAPLPPRRVREVAGSGGVDRSSWRDVVLALGGNLGDVPTTLAHAVAELVDLDVVQVLDVSPLVRTRAVLAPDQDPQPDYWNAVVLARTGLGPEELLAATTAIETSLGRVRHEHWGARTLDIDIVQYAGVTSEDPRLTLPHPRAWERAFVLVPWELVDPGAVLEGVGSVADLARGAHDRSGVLDAVSDWLEEPGSVTAESDEVLAQRDSASVIQTPAGGSVVVATESRPQAGPSRLDLVPEASRAGLRPSETGEDYLWHRLWEQWEGATQPHPEQASGDRTSPEALAGGLGQSAPAAPSTDTRPGGRTPDAAVPQAGPARTHGAPGVDPAAGERPGDTFPSGDVRDTAAPAAPAPGTRRSTDPEPAHRTADGTTSAPADAAGGADSGDTRDAGSSAGSPRVPSSSTQPTRRRAGMWVPLRGNTDHSRTGGSADPAAAAAGRGSAAGSGHPAPARRTPALPDWDFITGESVRIVDDAADLRPADPHPGGGDEDAGQDSPHEDPEESGTAPTVPPTGGDGRSSAAASPGDPDEQTTARSGDGAGEHPRPRRSILRVDLPPGTPEGPLEEDERTRTSILRGITVRPTVTGQLPVRRHPRHEDGQA